MKKIAKNNIIQVIILIKIEEIFILVSSILKSFYINFKFIKKRLITYYTYKY